MNNARYTPTGWREGPDTSSTHWPDVAVVLVGIVLFVLLSVRIPL